MTARSQRSGWFEPLCGPAADSLTVASSNIRLLLTCPTITAHLWDSRDTVTRPPGHLAATLPVRPPAAIPGAAIEPDGQLKYRLRLSNHYQLRSGCVAAGPSSTSR